MDTIPSILSYPTAYLALVTYLSLLFPSAITDNQAIELDTVKLAFLKALSEKFIKDMQQYYACDIEIPDSDKIIHAIKKMKQYGIANPNLLLVEELPSKVKILKEMSEAVPAPILEMLGAFPDLLNLLIEKINQDNSFLLPALLCQKFFASDYLLQSTAKINNAQYSPLIAFAILETEEFSNFSMIKNLQEKVEIFFNPHQLRDLASQGWDQLQSSRNDKYTDITDLKFLIECGLKIAPEKLNLIANAKFNKLEDYALIGAGDVRKRLHNFESFRNIISDIKKLKECGAEIDEEKLQHEEQCLKREQKSLKRGMGNFLDSLSSLQREERITYHSGHVYKRPMPLLNN